MKGHSQQSLSPQSLTPEHWDVPIRVRLVPYIEFTQWLEDELEKLVQQWSGQAAPAARQSRR